jgi:hypothetical protein
MIWLLPHPLPSPFPAASCLSFSVFLCVARERGEWGVGGAKSYDGEKAWSSIDHSILSAKSKIMLPPLTVMWSKSSSEPESKSKSKFLKKKQRIS